MAKYDHVRTAFQDYANGASYDAQELTELGIPGSLHWSIREKAKLIRKYREEGNNGYARELADTLYAQVERQLPDDFTEFPDGRPDREHPRELAKRVGRNGMPSFW